MSATNALGRSPEIDPSDESKPKEPAIVVVGARDHSAQKGPKKQNPQRGGEENRRDPRLPLVVKAEVGANGRVQRGYLTNLSVGGAFLATKKPIPSGTQLQLLVFLPWKLGEFKAEAEVVWSTGKEGSETDPPGVGLAFTKLDFKGEQRLQRYVERFYQLVAQIDE